VITRVADRLPVLILGDYTPDRQSGPAIWLRCLLAGQVEATLPFDDQVPSSYCPGVSREELRSLEDMDEALQPIAELQYRAVWWSHSNGRDWTLAGLLNNRSKGLGLDLKEDAATATALARAISRVLEEPVASLRGRQLNAEDFDALLVPDSRRGVLQWLNDPEGFRKGRPDNEWGAFAAGCKKEFGFDPESDGPLTAAELLGQRDGPWSDVWERYAEAPEAYPNIPDALDRARPQELLPKHPDSWPSFNAEREGDLRSALKALGASQVGAARDAIGDLEAHHGERRGWLWARLGRAPLSQSLGYLLVLADASAVGWKQGDTAHLAAQYVDSGWRADDAVVRALACVDRAEDIEAVKTAADVLYRVWLEDGARALQEATQAADLKPLLPALAGADAGTCVLFTDGLRMDAAHRLQERLQDSGCEVGLQADFAALPSVTATAKPAVSPAAGQLTGGPELSPSAPSGQAKLSADGLRKLLKESGWQVLKDDCGDPSGRAWTEYGDIDELGHTQGAKLARSLDAELGDIAQRIEALLGWGWKRVVVVTDHGWLLVPGGLKKVDLPEHLTEHRKGRCARLKPDVATEFLTLPWRWDPAVDIAYASGICTFVAGAEYDHGGISPQECVTPRLTVTKAVSEEPMAADLAEPVWVGMRCRVAVEDAPIGAQVDLRGKAADASTSLLSAPVAVKDGSASALVSDDELEGTAVLVVLLDAEGKALKQRSTTVGGET